MYRRKTHIHFVGIGGIGMSGIAKILHMQGYRVSGCDADIHQKSVEELVSLGCNVFEGNNTSLCADPSVDVLVYSSAIRNDNAEIAAAQQRGIPTIPRALMLAELMRTKLSINVSGAHGKTTTTSYIAHILIEAQIDPTVIIGGHLKNISTNARFGEGDILVAEADESDRSLLRLYPTIAVLTNIDREHLDVYKDIEDIKQTFKTFLSNVPFYGCAIVCDEDPYIKEILPLSHIKVYRYGFSREADLYATDLVLDVDHSQAVIWRKGDVAPLGKLHIPMPGKHNVLNALAAIQVAQEVGISFAIAADALRTFKGIDRRFTFKGKWRDAELFDDYGHHPTEIACTLDVARARAKNKLVVVFQPHRFSRTQALWQEFINAFASRKIDHLFVTDIYPASEAPIDGITSIDWVADFKRQLPDAAITYVPLDDNFARIRENLEEIHQEDNLILFLGAGKMNKVADKLLKF
jgi:UDP-N-acetylmuramate--alanine ligase